MKLAAEAASEVKPRYLAVLDLRGLCSFTDHFIIISADTDRQVRALADRVEERLAKTQARILHHKVRVQRGTLDSA